MDSKGYLTIETALTFPMFLLLTVVLIFVLIVFIKPETRNFHDNGRFMERVHTVDSIGRKAEIVYDFFE